MKIKLGVQHGIIIALVGFIIFISVLIFSIEKDQRNFELIEDDYYNKSIHYQEVIDAQNRANQLSKRPEINFSDEGLIIQFPDSLPVTKGHVNLIRPSSQKLDVSVPLIINENKRMIIPAKVLQKGHYLIKLNWENQKVTYNITKDIEWK